jgi:uracil-DNA glycosylase
MQASELFSDFNKLQIKHGEKNLDPIYGAGETKSPDICLVFMNPTAKNVSANKTWKGLKAPWIGTKNVWKLLFEINLINEKTLKQIIAKKNQLIGLKNLHIKYILK